MNKAVQFLKDCGVFYLATVEKDQPRVRPFGAVMEYEGNLYICTNNTKDCYKQMLANPKVEISGTIDRTWIRLCGEVAIDPRKETKAAMLRENPDLEKIYTVNDETFQVLYFAKATATIYDFVGIRETIELLGRHPWA